MPSTTRLIALAEELNEYSRLAGTKAAAKKAENDTSGYWMYVGLQDGYGAAANLVYGLVEVETSGEEVAS